MRKFKPTPLWLTAPLVVVMLFVVALLTGGNSVSSAHGAIGPSTSAGGRTPQRPVGIPAIQPRTAAVSGPVSISTPAFTAADATQYVTTHHMWRNLDTSRPTVVSVSFISSGEVSAILHTTTGQPDDALMCYVVMKGTFTFPGLNGPVTYHRGFEVFDAHTGNSLLAGGQP